MVMVMEIRDFWDYLLLSVQIATLFALVIYVCKTWHIASASRRSSEISENILKEMKESRDQETRPYVVVYVEPHYGRFIMHLVVENIGKTIARNVKLEFHPQLESSNIKNISDIHLIKYGIRSMPPGYKIRTFLDTTNDYFKKEKELPLKYAVKVSYSGGLQPEIERIEEHKIDLSPIRELIPSSDKGIHQLVEEAEKLVGQLAKHNNEIVGLINKLIEQINIAPHPLSIFWKFIQRIH